MKKKEILARLNASTFGGLIIFGLALLVTGLSWFHVVVFETYVPTGWWIFRVSLVQPAPSFPIIQRGLPIYYWTNWPEQAGSFQCGFLAVDLFFWSLVLAVGWWVVKKFKKQPLTAAF